MSSGCEVRLKASLIDYSKSKVVSVAQLEIAVDYTNMVLLK